ncbi:MAG TPA: MMPL family transporter, partial [Dehalococcoidia bacterium]|nr:MMPL family transporter [Dehalococcoidia bacterium]
SPDRQTTNLVVTMTARSEDAVTEVGPLLDFIKDSGNEDFEVLTVGDGSVNKEVEEQFMADLLNGEMIGLPAAAIILLIVFGAAVAAGIPLITALLGIVLAMGITAIFGQFFELDDVVKNIIFMIGLAVGIDYTLFIVQRFREERQAGLAKVEAIVMAGNTAGRAVLFSGLTVIIALSGLFIVPESTFRGIAAGAISVVVAAVLIAMTLLPALLSLVGDRVNALRLPFRRQRTASDDKGGGFWTWSTGVVMRHPVISVVVSGGLLLAAAAPYATMKLGDPGLTEFPQGLQSVRAYQILNEDFSAGLITPTKVVIEADNVNSPEVRAAVQKLEADLAGDQRYEFTGEFQVSQDRNLAVYDIALDGDFMAEDARQAVKDLRADYVPAAFDGTDARVLVGGSSASSVDYLDTMNTYLPIVIAFVLALSFLLLLVVFRSIVIPIKAIAMNLLSVGAAYGLLVLVFQHGVGASLLGFQEADAITGFIPLFMFAILFGLSMDYHVFLLTRIQERYLKTGDNAGSVAYGLRSTAGIITGAAAIMVAVFAGFALGEMPQLQQMGFGLAVAIFLDATIVRSVLVPASMEMLGKWNWYLPTWLEWLPKVHVDGSPVDLPDARKEREALPLPAGAD